MCVQFWSATQFLNMFSIIGLVCFHLFVSQRSRGSSSYPISSFGSFLFCNKVQKSPGSDMQIYFILDKFLEYNQGTTVRT